MSDSNLAIRIQMKKKPQSAAAKPELEILWGRVLGAACVIGMLAACLSWWVYSWQKTDANIEPPYLTQTSTAEPKPTSESKLELAVTQDLAAEKIIVAEQSVAEQAIAETTANVAKSQSGELETLHSANSTEQVKITSDTVNVAEDKVTEPQPKLTQKITKNITPAKVTIKSSNILKAEISDQIKKRKAGKPLPNVVSFAGKELLTVYFFTEYQNAKGQWMYHDWYRNGKRMARVKARPHLNNFDAYSSKFIDQHMLGDWQVKVTNASGEPLATAQFKVVL